MALPINQTLYVLISLGAMALTVNAQELATSRSPAKIRKPQMSDTIKANLYADNWLYCISMVNSWPSTRSNSFRTT